jgi:hypothetical protein
VTARRRGARSGLGLLGLGSYGLGLCALGAVGIVAPLLPHSDPAAAVTAAARADRTAAATAPRPAPADNRPGSLLAGPVLPPLVVPQGVLPGDDGAPSALLGDNGTQRTFRPLEIVMPSGRIAPVQQSGLRSDGTLAIPDDPSVVGWWTGGALIGERFGSTVIAGHVDSRRFGIGVFAELWQVRPGAVVEVRNGALHVRYRVVSRTEVPQARMTRETGAFRQDVNHRLVLITCGGPFDHVRHRYRDNIVLIALPVT